MMKILRPDVNHLRNEEHYQFGGEFGEIVKRSGAAELKIEKLFDTWTLKYRLEGVALQKITKSAYTGYINEASEERDQAFRGILNVNRGLLSHFDQNIKTAAYSLQIIFDTYGNIPVKPLTEKTGSYENLIEELRTETNIEAVKTVGLVDWIVELHRTNQNVFQLTQQRNNEAAGKISVSVKDTRREVDIAYEDIMKRVGALLLIEGEGNAEVTQLYETLIRRHNAAVARYNTGIAARRGRGGIENPSEA